MSSPIAGYDAVYVSRADYQEIAQRTSNRSLEYVWQPSPSLGAAGSTFFGIMNSGLHLYFPLPGLCWDAINCNDPVVQDNPALEDYNVEDVVSRAIYQFRNQAINYVGGDVWFTAGFDFNFEFAEEWFINLDKMIHYINLVCLCVGSATSVLHSCVSTCPYRFVSPEHECPWRERVLLYPDRIHACEAELP